MPRKKPESEPLDPAEAIKALEGIEKAEGLPGPFVAPPGKASEVLTARAECKARMVVAMERGLKRYYERFPDRENDERAIEAAKWSIAGLKYIFLILDEYDVMRKVD